MRPRPTARGTLKRKPSSVVSHQHMRPPWRFFSAKNASDAELFRSANGHGVAGCLADRCEVDRGWSTLSPLQHGETAVIRGDDAGATGRQRRHAGAASAEADLEQLGRVVAQDAGALLVRELRRLHDALDRIAGRGVL